MPVVDLPEGLKMNEVQTEQVKEGLAMTAVLTLTTIVAKQAVQVLAGPFVDEPPKPLKEQVEIDTKDAIAWACITGIAGGFLALALKKYKLSVNGDIV